MTDRELLELAARAAGYKICARGSESVALVLSERKPDGTRLWNPLADDGDALRLAVACDMTIWADGVIVSACSGYGHDKVRATVAVSECGADKNYAVRRAIVRAAAELGKRDAGEV